MLTGICFNGPVPTNISKFLSKKYGGKWKYDHQTSWWCDDNLRHVARTCSCSCDEGCGHPPVYYLYQVGFDPQWVEFW